MRSVLLILILGATVCFAQESQYKNLKVLPKDISKDKLTGVMKAWSQALGVRCNFCHVGEPNAPLSSYDFASDDKDHKRITRQMVDMVKAINADYLAKLDENSSINCRTCHHGLASPRTLGEALNRSLERKGLDEAVKAYGQLRERYYGSDSYDFTEGSLLQYASYLSNKGKKSEAMRFIKLNLEHYPKSAESHYQLAELVAESGDKAGAVSLLQKALAIDPKHEEAKQRLEKLK